MECLNHRCADVADGALRHQGFFNNKPLGVSLCLRAFVAILLAAWITKIIEGESTLGMILLPPSLLCLRGRGQSS